ncbi:hypothetical protein ACLOJK_037625 [Asimina triloba]
MKPTAGIRPVWVSNCGPSLSLSPNRIASSRRHCLYCLPEKDPRDLKSFHTPAPFLALSDPPPMAADTDSDSCCGTIVLFPFMAQGHLNPFLDLAFLLSSRHPSLSLAIVSTPANLLNIRPLFRSIPAVRLLSLPFNSSDHGLPPNIDHTRSLSRAQISALYHASQSLQPAFHQLISSLVSDVGPPLLCIVADMFLAWTVEISRAFGLLHAALYTSGPYAMAIYNSIWTHLPHRLTSAHLLTLPDLPGVKIHRSQLSANMLAATEDSASSVFNRRQAELCQMADGTLWNTADVLERLSLDQWARSSGKPVWAIGPLALAAARANGGAAGDRRGGWEPSVPAPTCAGWLDLHPPNSVVYVSFGSQSSIGAEQMMELANGLEASGAAFVWAVRPPIGFDADGELDEARCLPEGFEDRVREKKQGLLIRKWAPQLEILKHPATGAFVSHCGWNSVLESLSCGVPMIGWPLASEQFYNSKLVVEKLGACEEVGRGDEVVVGAEEVARVVKEVLEGERGREMRERAERLRKEMELAVREEGSSMRALDEFVETRWEKLGTGDETDGEKEEAGGGGRSGDGRLEVGDPVIGSAAGGGKQTGKTKERLEGGGGGGMWGRRPAFR